MIVRIDVPADADRALGAQPLLARSLAAAIVEQLVLIPHEDIGNQLLVRWVELRARARQEGEVLRIEECLYILIYIAAQTLEHAGLMQDARRDDQHLLFTSHQGPF